MKIQRPVLSSPASQRKPVTLEFDAAGLDGIDEVHFKGSFNPETGEHSADWNQGATYPMRDDGRGPDRVSGDGIFTVQVDLKEGDYSWGAVDQDGRWLVTHEQAPRFSAAAGKARYAPVSHHRYGLHKTEDGGLRIQTWAPNSRQLTVEFREPDGQLLESHPLKRVEGSADWTLEIPGGFERLEGKSYVFNNGESTYIDPYARHLQGQQRGLERIFVDPILGFETGWYDDSGKGGPNYADNPQWGRFHVDGNLDAERVELVLKDESGKQLSRQDLLQRLGRPEFLSYEEAPETDRRDVDVLRSWQLDKSPSIAPYVWTHEVGQDGAIAMQKRANPTTGGGWVTAVNNFPELVGLDYEFRVYRDGQLVGDIDGNGDLDDGERKTTAFNEPENTISLRPGSARGGLVRESVFKPKHFNTPRLETDPTKLVIYEAHVGSFLSPGDNAVAATFEDMITNLDYLTELGVNAIEVMPTQEFGGKRDWGYTPDHYFAGTEAYGFEMGRAEALEHGLIKDSEQPGSERVWINGTDAVKFFVDQAHARGFQVLGDVVYNHTSGKPDGDNPMARVDGEVQTFFRWPDGNFHHTPWGAKPNYANDGVKDFFANHAVSQLTEYGFDGLRFDFTQVLHNTGDAYQQIEGMNTLRQISRAMELARPGLVSVAEDFSGNWLVAADLDRSEWQNGVEKKGMGFDAVWNDRFRDDTFEAAHAGSMDRLMDALLNHHGVSGWDRAVLYSHSHDEVGNSGEWVARAAAGGKADDAIMQEHPRGVARAVATLTLLGPGVPMLWQGEEFLANNDFKHGLTSTWGQPTDWLDPNTVTSESEARRGHHQAYRELIALRGSSEAFTSTSSIGRVFTHNADQVMAFSRAGGGDEFVVVANFSGHDREGYQVNLPAGRWKEVFNSDAAAFGGGNFGNGGATVNGGDAINLPGSAALVFQRV